MSEGLSRAGESYYDNIGRWDADLRYVTATMTYRLTPEFVFPAGAEDVAFAVSWIEHNIADAGRNPSHIVPLGHSAGGSHVPIFLASPTLLRSLPYEPAGATLSSGVYDPSVSLSCSPRTSARIKMRLRVSRLSREWPPAG